MLFDIETAPILAYVWGLWENNVSINQINRDWHILSWAAKWLKGRDGTVYGPHDRIMYMDQRRAKNIEDDSKILKGIWDLLNEADIVIGQNSDQFDIKKLNARFLINGMQPPSSFKSIDTRKIAKRKFGFTSNKLEYMADKINKKFKKLKHEKFTGQELWTECLSGNREAWREMQKYNTHDVLALEELYLAFQPWDRSLNINLYTDDKADQRCACGSQSIKLNGYQYTPSGRYQRYRCLDCGSEVRGRTNEFSNQKKKSIKIALR